ncbi:MAG: oligoendopeptidase F [Clostridiales bacterium]|jgi:oligoendopeptidase F|nr:oligoendopeptidase F [Clostridiales bacterium]
MANLIKKREEIDDRFKWRVSDLIPSDSLWQQGYEEILSGIASFAQEFDSSFATSPKTLKECLDKRSDIMEQADRLYVYANLKLAENNGDPLYQAMSDKADNMIAKLSSAFSFIEPALAGMDENLLESWMALESGLAAYAHYFEDLMRQKEHVLSPEMEELLASATELAQAPGNIFTMLNNADMKFGSVTDEEGEEVELTLGRYSNLIESDDRQVRKAAFEKLFDAYIRQKNTLAAVYSASVKKDIFFSKARKYSSSMDEALSSDNIGLDVYANLIQAVKESLPALHRYIRLRKKALNLEELHMYDLYNSIIPKVETKLTFEQAKDIVAKALAPLGRDYTDAVLKGFEGGWIDVYENEGKKSGAFAWGSYGCHPFVLLNFNGTIDAMFTLAHEMGHAMHSWYSWGNQPYMYGDYTIFLAEVASTVNEALLMDYLRKNESDSAKRAYLVNFFLEQFRTTVFRQAMFAEFEMKTHEMSERGEPLTAQSLSGLYRSLNEEYYGPEVVSDLQIEMEWSRIPHFYNAFYVFQYATGFSAAAAFSRRILSEGEAAVEKYKGFLKSGSSDYSLSILKKAGVDMSSPQPVREAMELFEELVIEMEELAQAF